MPIWQLDPVNAADNNWRASTYSGRVIIRAPDELRARKIANLAFGIFAEYPSTDIPDLPWMHSELVECQKTETGPYEEEGAEAILDPSKYDNKWRR